MKKLFFLATLLTALTFNAKSQEFYHMTGGTGIFTWYQQDIKDNYAPDDVPLLEDKYNAFLPGFTYGAKLSWLHRPNVSFGIGAYPFVGFYIQTVNFQTYGILGVDVPVYGEIILGDREGFNFTAGLGFDFNMYNEFNFPAEFLYGPSAEIGGQVFFNQTPYNIRLQYTYGLNDGKIDLDQYRVVSGSRHLLSVSILYPLNF